MIREWIHNPFAKSLIPQFETINDWPFTCTSVERLIERVSNNLAVIIR